MDVGDCVTVYHIPTASLQRGLVLSLHSYSPNAVEYLIQYDSLDLGHGIVSDELIAIHGDVPLRYQKKRIYGDSNTQNVAWSTTEEADSDRGTVNSSLNDVQLAHNTPHSLSSSTRETLEELWGKCLEESLTLLEELLTSSSLSLPPPPDLSRLTSSNQSGGSNVSTDGKSFLLLSSTDIKCENEVNQIDDDTIEELLQPLVASLMFFKNALSTNTQSSSQSDPFFPSSIQLDQTFISEMHHFLIEKIHQVYGISSTSTSLSQLYENILKCLLPKSPVPQSYRSGSLFNRPIPRSIPSSESTLGPIRGQNPAES